MSSVEVYRERSYLMQQLARAWKCLTLKRVPISWVEHYILCDCFKSYLKLCRYQICLDKNSPEWVGWRQVAVFL
jgi:hypothetical protein